MINPARLLQLKRQYSAFTARHPKFLHFLAYATDHCLEDGTVMDLTFTDTQGKALHGNAKLTPEDVTFLKEVRDLLRD